MTLFSFPRIALPALVAAIAVTGLQTAAFAGAPDARTASLSYAGLDLATPEGRQTLDGRIARAVRDVCAEPGVRDLGARQRERACAAETRSAVGMVRDQLVANAMAGANRTAAATVEVRAVD